MPEGAVYVGRSSKWGNPFIMQSESDREDVVYLYRERLVAQVRFGEVDLSALRGKDLVCWCPLDQPCHADILLEIANSRE